MLQAIIMLPAVLAMAADIIVDFITGSSRARFGSRRALVAFSYICAFGIVCSACMTRNFSYFYHLVEGFAPVHDFCDWRFDMRVIFGMNYFCDIGFIFAVKLLSALVVVTLSGRRGGLFGLCRAVAVKFCGSPAKALSSPFNPSLKYIS